MNKPTTRPLRVVVIGAGIGGLACAIALRQVGHDVAVFERADELREAGAGLTLWSNAIRCARQLGLERALLDAGAELRRAEIRASGGRLLAATSVADLSRELGAPSLAIARADLQAVLLGALPRDVVTLGARCVRLDDGVHFANGSTERGDVVVGADGVHSVVRAQLHGEQPLREAGYTCWRALLPFEHARLPPGLAFETWGRGARFGAVGVGRGRVYWFATANAAPGGRDGDVRAELLARFGAWHEPIGALLEATDPATVQRLDIADRPPLAAWGRDAVTLLGDAAHATTPNLGQGACLAFEDAIVLRDALALDVPTADALRRYEATRNPRAAFIIRRSRALGRVGQLRQPLLCAARDLGLRLTPAAVLRRGMLAALAGGP